jgi:hypothetical protein
MKSLSGGLIVREIKLADVDRPWLMATRQSVFDDRLSCAATPIDRRDRACARF